MLTFTFSPTGGTQKVTALFQKYLNGTENEEYDLMRRDFACGELTEAQLCLIAVPSFGGRVPAPAADNILKIQANGAKAILLVVYGNRAYDDTLAELKQLAGNAGFTVTAAAAVNAEHSLIRSFGAGRPDERDAADVAEFCEKINKKLADGVFHDVAVPGNIPTTPYRAGGMPMSVGENCTGCGFCAKLCPTGAIADNPQERDGAKCINCMACVFHCPVGARALPRELVDGIHAKLAPVCAERKNNELFL